MARVSSSMWLNQYGQDLRGEFGRSQKSRRSTHSLGFGELSLFLRSLRSLPDTSGEEEREAERHMGERKRRKEEDKGGEECEL